MTAPAASPAVEYCDLAYTFCAVLVLRNEPRGEDASGAVNRLLSEGNATAEDDPASRRRRGAGRARANRNRQEIA